MSTTRQIPKNITALEDVIPLSRYVEPAIRIVREHMKFDSGHDEQHLVRVVRDALDFSQGPHLMSNFWVDVRVDYDVLLPACILHDLVNYPKDHPHRSKASYESGKLAIEKLEEILPFKSNMHHVTIWDTIESHSWSAGVEPKSLEAKCLQDADRIEALGKIGIARLFSVGGSMGRALWHPTDPLAKHRELDELAYTLDHASVKLGKLYLTMKTERGCNTAIDRTKVMMEFIKDLMIELGFDDNDQLRKDVSKFTLGFEDLSWKLT